MSLAKFSVNQAIFVNLLFLIFVFAGGAMYMQLPVDVYPDLSLDEAWQVAFEARIKPYRHTLAKLN
ncbi:MAG: hypothetical protein IIC79_06850 [Chloroflexi bacterium]|nr:hypothetical protein [Chloroflexota bacterium]